jgi:hypothetical protein
MTSYSAFFSSGLLAAPLMYNNHSFSFPRRQDESSSTRAFVPSSSMSSSLTDILDDTSDIELDRSNTPTPAGQSSSSTTHQAQAQPQPRLRRRRSSLTIGTSPMNIIRSPTRSVGNALQLQRHLLTSPGRSRSGSASSVISIEEEQLHGGSGNIASERTSLVGRMRSGSVGSALKSRRIRRFPGPSCPPPSAPLPPLPSIPGTPNRSKAFSLAVSPSTTQALARKLAAASGDALAIQTNVLAPSPMLTSPRQPLGDLQPHGYRYANEQEMGD